MSRRNAASKREVIPDPLFESIMVTKLINRVMMDGKKSTAERIVYNAFARIATGAKSSAALLNDSARKNVLESLNKALENVSPKVEVESRRMGGSVYQVPVEVRAERRDALGLGLLVEYAAKRSEKTSEERLANEIKDALQGKGGAAKRCEEIHKMAAANKVYAHWRGQ